MTSKARSVQVSPPNSQLSSDWIDPRFQDRRRRPGLDLLRSLAVIVVVIYHAGIMGFPLPGRVHRFGWVGVDLFFVLSGYLIGGQLLTPLAKNQRVNLPRFFARRALRILPAYFVVLGIYFLFRSWWEYPTMSPLWKFLISVQNIGLHGGTTFSHAWSLAVEDQFYLLLPLILLFIHRWPGSAVVIPSASFLGGLSLRAFLASHNLTPTGVSFPEYQAWIYYPTWTRLDPLVFGVVLAAVEKFRPQVWKQLTNIGIWLWLPGFALIVYALWLGESKELSVTACICQFPLVASGMAMLLLCAVSNRFPLSRRSIPGAAFFASIAYSAYLVQKLVIHFVGRLCSNYDVAPASWFALLSVEICVYATATILFLVVERPFLQLRRRVAH